MAVGAVAAAGREPVEPAPVGVVVADGESAPVAEATADITAATTTAVSGAASLCPEGLMRRASSSSDPFRKKTSRPSISAGTSSRARTSSGHTSDDSRPKTPA